MKNTGKTTRKSILASEPLSYTGHTNETEEVGVSLFYYEADSYGKRQITDFSHLSEIHDIPGIKWINVDGIHDVDIVESIGMQFGIHFLVLEDILDVNQRPKMEDHDLYLYTVLKMVYLDKKSSKIVAEHVSLLIFSDMVITFQERMGYDVFDPIRNRIMNNRGKIRREGADYLAYSLLDAIIDNYISVMGEISEEIASLEKEVLSNPTTEILEDIYTLKMDIVFYRKAIWPLREMMIQFQKVDSDLISEAIAPYFRDIYDHTLQALDSVKVYNDTLSGILDIYTSSISNRTNVVMRRLTIITTIFMPLTLLASIGGMSEWTVMTGGEKNIWIAYPMFFVLLLAIGFGTYWLLKRMK